MGEEAPPKTGESSLRLLPLAAIRDHPQNPRLLLRQDVIDGIAANLNGSYPQKHAIHVRPKGDYFETLAGHHRRHAAGQSGLTEIWAWVEELDDDAAYMELALSNTQGELSPLEIGLHALYAVPLGERGRGHEGGLREYARRIGKGQSTVVEYRQAAEVFTCARENDRLGDHFPFLDKYKHLAAVHSADRATWPALVAYLAQNDGLSADKMAEVVQHVRRFTIPVADVHWLPLADVVRCYLTEGHPTPRMVAQLIEEADAIRALLAAHDLDPAPFEALLTEQCARAAWERRTLMEYRHQLELAILEAAHKLPELVTLYQQDFRTLDIEPGSVDLILTDPPYDSESGQLYADLSSCAARWLKPGGSLVVYCGQGRLGPVLSALSTELRYWWTLALVHHGPTQIMPIQEIAVGWKPIAWLSKGEPRYRLRDDVLEGAGREKALHPWQQAVDEARLLLGQLCPEGGVLLDPMMGSGTTLLAGLAEGRRVIGCERDPATFAEAERRIRGDLDAT